MLELGMPQPRVFRHHGQQIESASVQEGESGLLQTEVSIWETPILRTVATEGDGVPELVAAIARHRAHLGATGEWERRERARLEAELEALVGMHLIDRWRREVSQARYLDVLDRLAGRTISPHEAVEALLDGGELA
jgi:LAO/AO transport system kinase